MMIIDISFQFLHPTWTFVVHPIAVIIVEVIAQCTQDMSHIQVLQCLTLVAVGLIGWYLHRHRKLADLLIVLLHSLACLVGMGLIAAYVLSTLQQMPAAMLAQFWQDLTQWWNPAPPVRPPVSSFPALELISWSTQQALPDPDWNKCEESRHSVAPKIQTWQHGFYWWGLD